MHGSSEDQRGAIRPEFNRSIMMDFQGAKITSDVGFLLLREIDNGAEVAICSKTGERAAKLTQRRELASLDRF